MKHLTTPLLFVAGALLGLFLVVLLPVVFGIWLSDWWQSITGTPHVCDGGEGADLSPTEEDALHTCGDCGAELQIVRPGKYQCVNCEAQRAAWVERIIDELMSDRSTDA
jgi:hypothetical protein